MSQQLKNEFILEGFIAYTGGITTYECPYSELSDAEHHWMAGWFKAQRQAKLEMEIEYVD